MPPNHLILCHPLLLLPSIFPRIMVFSNESVLCNRWPKYWSVSFSISPCNEYSGLISFRIDCFDLLQFRTLVCHLLPTQSVKVKVLVAQPHPTLCDPMDSSSPGSSVYGIFQAWIPQWVAISYSRGPSQARDWTHFFCVSCIGRQILYYFITWDVMSGIHFKITEWGRKHTEQQWVNADNWAMNTMLSTCGYVLSVP